MNAVCLAGEVRSLWHLRHNFESALVVPNHAHVFAHVYVSHEQPNDEKKAVRWLLQAPWLQQLVVETLNSSLETRIIADFPRFDILNASKGERAALRYASMWRKIKLADELRLTSERQNGWRYRSVVRTRPDIAFGAVVKLDNLDLSLDVLYTAHPPAATGAVWRFCSGWNGVNEGSCGQLPSSACIESPMLHDPRTAVIAECPCCSPFRNPFHEELVHSCTAHAVYTSFTLCSLCSAAASNELAWLQHYFR